MKVFVSRNVGEEGCSLLRHNGFEVIINREDYKHSTEELIEICQGVDFLLNDGLTSLDAVFIEKCSHLRDIDLASVGYDYVDLAAANKYHIPVSNTPDVLSGAT